MPYMPDAQGSSSYWLLQAAFEEAHAAVSRLAGEDGCPCTTLVVVLETPDSFYLSYAGDGSLVAAPEGLGRLFQRVIPQHDAEGRLTGVVGGDNQRFHPVHTSLSKAQHPGLVLVLATDGVARGEDEAALPVIDDLLSQLQRRTNMSSDEAEQVVLSLLERSDLLDDDRTLCLIAAAGPDSEDGGHRASEAEGLAGLLIGGSVRGPKPRNEDAWGMSAMSGFRIAAVADGVGSTPRADLAAKAAIAAVLGWFERWRKT